jgi:hypothetical protein
MARRERGSLLEDEIMQELLAVQLSDDPSDCKSDKRSNDDDDDHDFGPSTSRKGRKRARLEVSVSVVNTDDDGDADDGLTKNYNLRNLEQYLCNTSLIFTPDNLPIHLK